MTIQQKKTQCDDALQEVVKQISGSGIETAIILDRLLTLGAAYLVASEGSDRAAQVLRDTARRIDMGLLNHLAPQDLGRADH